MPSTVLNYRNTAGFKQRIEEFLLSWSFYSNMETR